MKFSPNCGLNQKTRNLFGPEKKFTARKNINYTGSTINVCSEKSLNKRLSPLENKWIEPEEWPKAKDWQLLDIENDVARPSMVGTDA